VGESGLLERDGELADLATVVSEACEGDGRLVVVEGPAGIGKTRLLGGARQRARAAGMRVLSARGGELERAYAFGVVRQLFEPVLAAVSERERDALLSGAAGLATRVLDAAEPAGAAGDPFAAYHGLYWLAANLSARVPTALAVDDLHWCDAPSLGFLDFLGRRLEGLPLLVVVATRPDEPGAEQALIDSLAHGPASRVLRPLPLSRAASVEFVRAVLSDADPEFCRACHDASGGNPLLLAELAGALRAQRIAPTAANASRVLELGPQAVSRAVRLRLAALPPAAGTLAEAASVLGDGGLVLDAVQLAGLGREEGLEAAAALVRVELLRPTETVEFVHPVLRAAVYAGLGLAGQRLGHVRAARLLADRGRPAEQVAAHLLSSPPTGDPAAVSLLRAAARRSLAEGAAQVAVTYLQRALREPPPADQRAALLVELGSAESSVHGPAAADHLQEALALASEPVARAAISLALARTLYFSSRIDEAASVFDRGLAAPDLAPALARSLETGFVVLGLFEPQLVASARERLRGFDRGAEPVALDDLILLAYATYDDARVLAVTPALAAERALRALGDGVIVEQDSQGAWAAVIGTLAVADRLDDAERVARAVVEAGQAVGSIFLTVSGLASLALVRRLRGSLADAVADGAGALETAQAHGFGTILNWGAGHLVNALVDRADLTGADEVVRRAGLDGPLPDSMHLYEAMAARGRLRLALGRTREGVDDLLEVGRRFEAVGGRNPSVLAWRSEAALGLLELGERDEACRLASDELHVADRWGAPRARSQARRVLGLALGGDPGLETLEAAVAVGEGSPALLERARALIELGAALRRANRRSDARAPLQAGLELAHRCAATGWQERALTELRASGARPRRLAASGRDALTPSELRVAELAAVGLSNREIAQRLFVTQKTVEAHLARTFRKLAVESRAQLAGALERGS
jgi:DNA-binding CsgD family transcriptional regulator